MDSNLLTLFLGFLGGIFGSIVGVISNIITQRYTLKLEEKKSENQQNVEKEKWERDRKKEESDKSETKNQALITTYQNCINVLSLLSAKDKTDSEKFIITGEKRLQLIEKAQDYLSLLSLRNIKKPKVIDETYYFNDTLNNFVKLPDTYADSMRQKLIELASRDKDLPFFLEPQEVKKTEPQSDKIKVNLGISEEFRKEELINGNIIPETYSFDINFLSLEKEQRKLLVEIYFKRGVIYSPIDLKDYKQQLWTAKLDPKSSNPKDFVEQWRVDYLEQQKNTKDGN